MSDASSLALNGADVPGESGNEDGLALQGDKSSTPSGRRMDPAAWMKRAKAIPNFQLWAILTATVLVTLVLAIIIWPDSGHYRTLYYGLSDKDTSAIAEHLQKSAIDYEIDKVTGNLKVNEEQLYDARLKIASAGLPRGTGRGLEFLDESPDIGRSQFAEQARYHHALEREISRSIAAIGDIEKARVHLAIPKRTVFIRERHQPSASVVVYLYPGRSLSQGQVMAIQHLVGSSVPDLQNNKVSVIDQRGQLLSTSVNEPGIKAGFENLQYTSELEARYIRRIEELLSPVVGVGKVQAQVTADVDFSRHESSSERFAPNAKSIRSEQLLYESQPRTAKGVPGATSNEPPSPAQFTEENTLRDGSTEPGGNASRQRKVRNYELDRVVSHDQRASAILKRLSIAVVVGKEPTFDPTRSEDGSEEETDGGAATASATAFSDEELERLQTLVKNAVGFDEQRGDTISIINTRFSEPSSATPQQWWQDDSSLGLIEYGLASLMFLILLVVVILPILRSARMKPPALPEAGALPALAGAEGEQALAALGSDGSALAGSGLLESGVSGNSADSLAGNEIIAKLLPEGFGESGDYESYVQAAQTIARENPRRAAEVLKGWITDND